MDPSNRFEENISLVGFVFQKIFRNQTNNVDDIMQEGYIALWRACCLFDENKGFKFSTYACKAIRFAMTSFLRKEIDVQSKIISMDSIITEDGEGGGIFLHDILGFSPDNSIVENFLDICLNEMEKKDRDIIVLLLNGHTQKEVAKKTLTSQSSVSRCLCKFRKIVKEKRLGGL